MATISRHRPPTNFDIHEDGPATEDTEMNTDAVAEEDLEEEEEEEDDDEDDEEQDDEAEEADEGDDDDDEDQVLEVQVPEPQPEVKQESEAEGQDADDPFSEDEATMDDDMRKLQDAYPGFRSKYRLIKRIGEGMFHSVDSSCASHLFASCSQVLPLTGTFSTVYKAQDLQYHCYANKWDLDKENEKWTPPPLKRINRSSSTLANESQELDQRSHPRLPRRPKYVAIKKIYVTSSPQRILNELELLHDLKNCPAVCPLITAFRSTDQVVAILPYFRHDDFRDYFRGMTATDMAVYLRCLFTALKFTHEANIIHRDIKPTNFLYHPASRRGVLVDFGLAEREGVDTKPCICHDEVNVRRARIREAVLANGGPHHGYPKNDTRPSRRANRAGTRGFRAPEVLFKCTEQTTKLDIWSAGVILLTIMSRRFPFFNSADDVEAMIEIATIFGTKKMKLAAQVHGAAFETNIPTIPHAGFSLGKVILWSTAREGKRPFDEDEELAVDFLTRCMELEPSRRISAKDALDHDFLRLGMDPEGGSDEEDMDFLED